MQWYERQGLAKFITLYVIAHCYAFLFQEAAIQVAWVGGGGGGGTLI